jgi:hypothetical protein
LFTRVRVAAASGALFGTAAPPIFAKTLEECNAKYGAKQDVIKSLAWGRFLLFGFAQSVSAAARFKAHERLSASFGERAMPPSDRAVVRQEHRGDFRLRSQAYYSEKIVYLLNSYQPKDNRHQSRASKAPRPAYSIDDAKDIMDVFENAVRTGGGRHP